jgi:hypothetical protein
MRWRDLLVEGIFWGGFLGLGVGLEDEGEEVVDFCFVGNLMIYRWRLIIDL